MPKRNMFAQLSEEMGAMLHRSAKDAAASKAVPEGMKLATSPKERQQAWRLKVENDAAFAQAEWKRDSEDFMRKLQL